MINIIVTITATPEHKEKMLPLLEKLTEASQQENGNLIYQHYLHPTDPAQLAIVEVWQDADVLAAHEKTPHFTTLLPQIAKLALGLDIRKYESAAIE